jgi:uncharacterized protein YcgI (DUF1989 family)
MSSSSAGPVLPRASYPFPRAHYERIVERRERFETVSTDLVQTTGYGFRVTAGQAFRITLVEGPQILDVCMLAADDPHEHLFPGAQVAIEGGRVAPLTRLWGTPPRSRPLATCIADSVQASPSSRGTREHFVFGAHCNAHLWQLYTGGHGRPCYDNLRHGLATMGLGQRAIHDNVNLFMKGGYDPRTGASISDESDATRGDLIEFYAEIDLVVAVSLCPASEGSDDLRASWTGDEPGGGVRRIEVTVLDTGVAPLGWPQPA